MRAAGAIVVVKEWRWQRQRIFDLGNAADAAAHAHCGQDAAVG